MGSTSAALVTNNNAQAVPQAYVPSTDLYKAIAARQVGSSEYAIEVIPRGLTPSAFEAITVTTSGQSLNSTTYGSAIYAALEVQTAPINYRVDGVAASTAATGNHRADDTDFILLESSGEIANFRMVLSSTVTAVLVVTYST